MTPEQREKLDALRRSMRNQAFSDWDRDFLDILHETKRNKPLREWQESQLNSLYRQLAPNQRKPKSKSAIPQSTGFLF